MGFKGSGFPQPLVSEHDSHHELRLGVQVVGLSVEPFFELKLSE